MTQIDTGTIDQGSTPSEEDDVREQPPEVAPAPEVQLDHDGDFPDEFEDLDNGVFYIEYETEVVDVNAELKDIRSKRFDDSNCPDKNILRHLTSFHVT